MSGRGPIVFLLGSFVYLFCFCYLHHDHHAVTKLKLSAFSSLLVGSTANRETKNHFNTAFAMKKKTVLIIGSNVQQNNSVVQ